jgi:hypothetical protein
MAIDIEDVKARSMHDNVIRVFQFDLATPQFTEAKDEHCESLVREFLRQAMAIHKEEV